VVDANSGRGAERRVRQIVSKRIDLRGTSAKVFCAADVNADKTSCGTDRNQSREKEKSKSNRDSPRRRRRFRHGIPVSRWTNWSAN